MFCQSCRKQIPDTAKFCEFCGQPTANTAPQPSLAPPSLPPPATPPAPRLSTEPETSGKAIGSLFCGIFGFLFFPVSIVAVVLGHIARSEISKSAGRLKGAGMALGGLILGYTGIAIIPFLIIAAIAIPSLLKSRMAANEATAVGALRQYNIACVSYASVHPDLGFPANLSVLGPAGDELVDPILGPPGDTTIATKAGYQFAYTPGPRDRRGRINTYAIDAVPITPGKTGQRYFFTDESGVIRFERDGPASAYSTPLSILLLPLLPLALKG